VECTGRLVPRARHLQPDALELVTTVTSRNDVWSENKKIIQLITFQLAIDKSFKWHAYSSEKMSHQ
jgi:hypothetical protein